MAYQNNYNQFYNYGDQMGAMFGAPMGNDSSLLEQEEERKRRLLAEQQRQQQIIQSQQTGQVAPVAPVPQQNQTFNRMIQAESGGRQFDAQGNILTSPKGAQGVAQIMPATAANPGFGVQPATPQEIATPEGNRAFGQRYYQGLLQHFGGDEAKAVAAYNAGAGRVQQNMAANQGQLNVGQLPQETQRYMAQVMPVDPNQVQQQQRQNIAQRVLDPLITTLTGSSTAQAQPRPVAPPQVQPQPVPQVRPQMNVQPAMEQMGPPTSQMTTGGWAERINSASNDNQMLSQIASDPNAPVDIKQMAMRQQAMNINLPYQEQKYTAQGQEMLQNGKINEFTKLLGKDESETGLWFKRIFGSLLGMNDVAKDASMKLGYGSTVQQVSMPDGSLAAVRFNAMGTPIEGINAAGQVMTDRQLVDVAGQGMMIGGKGADFGQTLYKTPTGQVLKSGTINGRAVMVDAATNQRYTGSLQGLTPVAVGTDVENRRKFAAIELQNKLIGLDAASRLKAFEDYNKQLVSVGQAPFTLGDLGFDSSGNQIGAQGAPAQRGAPSGAPTTGGVPSGAPAQGGRATGEQIELSKEAKQIVVKKAAEVEADATNLTKKISDYDKNIKDLDAQKTNFGRLFSEGIIPGERLAGRMFGTEDNRNTQRILNDIKNTQASMAKLLGVNPTDRDLQFILENDPDETWTNADVADWFRRARAATKRTLEIARKQVESGGTYREPIPGERSEKSTGKGTKDDPIKLTLD